MQAKSSQKANPLKKSFAIITVVLGLIGWVSSFGLITEYIKTLIEPGYSPNCNLSVLVTCGPNMGSWQGSAFGFSNTILGLAAFMVPIIIGFAILAGAQLKQWFWRLYVIGLFLGFVFVVWLQYHSIFSLNTLCPWCMVAWAAMIPLWWYSLATLLKSGSLTASPAFKNLGNSMLQWAFVIIFLNIVLVAAIAQFKLNWLFTEFGIGAY